MEPPRFRVSDSALLLRAEDADVSVLLPDGGRTSAPPPPNESRQQHLPHFLSSSIWGETANSETSSLHNSEDASETLNKNITSQSLSFIFRGTTEKGKEK